MTTSKKRRKINVRCAVDNIRERACMLSDLSAILCPSSINLSTLFVAETKSPNAPSTDVLHNYFELASGQERAGSVI